MLELKLPPMLIIRIALSSIHSLCLVLAKHDRFAVMSPSYKTLNDLLFKSSFSMFRSSWTRKRKCKNMLDLSLFFLDRDVLLFVLNIIGN